MKRVLIHAEVYTGETVIFDGFVRFEKEISAVGKMSEYVPESGEEVIDAAGSRLVPGFIDVHSHGGYGVDNMDGDAEDINRMIAAMHREGNKKVINIFTFQCLVAKLNNLFCCSGRF